MSSPKNITIGVIGSGRMGTDIFYYLSDMNFRLVWICINAEENARLHEAYTRKIERQFRSNLIDEAGLHEKKQNTISYLKADLRTCDIIIEAIQENAADKAKLFADIAPVLGGQAVLVTNTSSIQPSLLILDDSLKKRFAGLHFFYPVKIKNIVELIVTEFTDDRTIAYVRKFIASIGKFHLEMHEEDAFILNRLFLDFQAQAYRLHHDDGLKIKEVDAIVKKHLFPVGVFEFFDAVGIDVMRQSIVNYTENMAGRDFYKPLIGRLDSLLSQKRLGRKSGAGFYDYPDGESDVSIPPDDVQDRALALLKSMYINAAYRALERRIWSRDNLEFAVKEYMGVDIGPFTLADEMGHGVIKELLQRYYEKTGFDIYRPSILL